MSNKPIALTEAQQRLLEPYDENLAKTVAKIVGAPCAAGRAIAELVRRREAGEAVGLFKIGNHIFVGPERNPSK